MEWQGFRNKIRTKKPLPKSFLLGRGFCGGYRGGVVGGFGGSDGSDVNVFVVNPYDVDRLGLFGKILCRDFFGEKPIVHPVVGVIRFV